MSSIKLGFFFACLLWVMILVGIAFGGSTTQFNEITYWRTLTDNEKQRLVLPEDWEYVGSFQLPQGTFGGSRFTNGGTVLAYRPDGDPSGSADGFPGSLYTIGHPNDQMVAEVSIPKPKISATNNPAELPVAQVLQPFADVTGGLKNQLSDVGILRGMAVVDVPQTGAKLHWALNKWYNVDGENVAGHGYSDLNLNNPNAKGRWNLADAHNQMTGGYLVLAPDAWAQQYTGGRRLFAGLTVNQGNATTSAGPAFFAFAPWLEPNVPPPTGASLSNVPLAYYPFGTHNLPGFKITDTYDGAAWLSAGTKNAVAVVGRAALGPADANGAVYYGVGRPGDCDSSKGYHGDPYAPRIMLIDPNDLAASAQKMIQPWDVRPYVSFDPRPYIYTSCDGELSGATFDSQRGLLYILQPHADESRNEYESIPLVHVFRINSTPSQHTPAAPTKLRIK